MEDFWNKAKHFGLGLFDFTKEKVEDLVDEMVKRGELTKQESSQAVAKIMEKAKAEQEALKDKLTAIIQKVLADMNLAQADDLEALEKRVTALEQKIAD